MNSRNIRIAAIALTVAVLLPATAIADNPTVNSDSFRPSVHPGDIMAITTAAMPKHLDFSAGIWLTWNHRPLKFMDPDGRQYMLVRDQIVADVVASLALFGIVDVGVDLPIFIMTKGDVLPAGLGLQQVSGTSVGDLRLGVKASFLKNHPGGFGLALASDLTFPTSYQNRYSGDMGVTGTTTIAGDWTGKGWLVALNVGARLRKEVAFGVRPFGHELILGAGVQAPIVCGWISALGTIETRTPFARAFKDRYDTSVDLMGGLRFNRRHVTVVAAAGAGVLQGYGSPVPRVTLQVAYAPGGGEDCTRDRDSDGIADKDDKCPDAPGIAAFSGCPDRDGDDVPDADDACPDAPGKRELHGCPDRDADGIPDRDDRCPDAKGIPELRGCPAPEAKAVEPRLEPRLELAERIAFDLNQATLRPEALPVLDGVAGLLAAHPEAGIVRIEGHSDNTGEADFNQTLSKRRAEAVMKYLAGRGVDPARMQSKGYGLTRPIADNTTEDGRSKNRRVEFVIIDR